MNDPDEVAAADEHFRAFQRHNLARAAAHFAVRVTGEPVFGWRLRTIGAPAEHDEHGPVWLRVISEFPEHAHGDAWTGTLDANAVHGVNKPIVLDVTEWPELDWRIQRAELSTRINAPAVSATDQLTATPHLTNTWWNSLADDLATIAAILTNRYRVTQDDVTRRITRFWGDQIDPHVTQWTTAHGDLHWANITTEPLTLLDWELWGTAPAGYDAATLLMHSLGVPATANEVQQRFATILNSPSGRLAQLDVIARLLLRAEDGDPEELTPPLHQQARRLVI